MDARVDDSATRRRKYFASPPEISISRVAGSGTAAVEATVAVLPTLRCHTRRSGFQACVGETPVTLPHSTPTTEPTMLTAWARASV